MKLFLTDCQKRLDRRLKHYKLPLIALVEAILFFAIAVIADEVWFGGNRFWDTQPHPFWLPVLMLTFQYGTGAGVLTSILATLSLFTGDYPAASFNQDTYEYIFTISKNPILWLLCAVILGELRLRHLSQTESYKETAEDYKQKRDLIYNAYMHIHSLKTYYEAHIRGQTKVAGANFQAVKKLMQTEERLVLENIAYFLSETIKAKQFSIYLRYGEMLVPALKNYQLQSRPEVFFKRPSDALIHAVIKEKRIICLAHAEDETILDSEALMAGPLQDDGGRVIGLLKIESLEFNDLNAETIEIFRAVCGCIGQALTVARYYDNLTGQVVFDHVNDESFSKAAIH